MRPEDSRTSNIRSGSYAGGREHLATPQRKARAVARTDDFTVFDGGIVERRVVVCTAIFECVQPAIHAHDADSVAVHFGFEM